MSGQPGKQRFVVDSFLNGLAISRLLLREEYALDWLILRYASVEVALKSAWAHLRRKFGIFIALLEPIAALPTCVSARPFGVRRASRPANGGKQQNIRQPIKI